MQNSVAICWAYFKLEYSEFWARLCVFVSVGKSCSFTWSRLRFKASLTRNVDIENEVTVRKMVPRCNKRQPYWKNIYIRFYFYFNRDTAIPFLTSGYLVLAAGNCAIWVPHCALHIPRRKHGKCHKKHGRSPHFISTHVKSAFIVAVLTGYRRFQTISNLKKK